MSGQLRNSGSKQEEISRQAQHERISRGTQGDAQKATAEEQDQRHRGGRDSIKSQRGRECQKTKTQCAKQTPGAHWSQLRGQSVRPLQPVTDNIAIIENQVVDRQHDQTPAKNQKFSAPRHSAVFQKW